MVSKDFLGIIFSFFLRGYLLILELRKNRIVISVSLKYPMKRMVFTSY